jgi:hypothetical protein
MLLSQITIGDVEASKLDEMLDNIVEVATLICNEVEGEIGGPSTPSKTQGRSIVFVQFVI